MYTQPSLPHSCPHSFLTDAMLVEILVFVIITWLTIFLQRRFSRQYVLAEKIGGPSGYPLLGHVHLFLRKEFLTAMTEMDSLYTGIARFWLGHKLVVGVNDPDLIEVVLSSKSALDKGEFYHFMKPLFGDGLIAADSKIWQINRKVVSPTLNALKVKSFAGVFVEGSDGIVEKWKHKIGVKFEPYTDISKVAFGFTIRTALGKTGDWSETQLETMVNLINRISAGVAYRFIRPWLYPEWIFNLTPTGKMVKYNTEAFRDFLLEMILMKTELKEEQSVEDGGFVSHVLNATRTNKEFPSKAVVDELSTYMTAGFETTSTAITFSMVMLGCFPELQEKVHKEQAQVLRESATCNWDRLCEMDYLERFIKETMRLFPVITIIGRQLSEDIIMGKKVVPKAAFALIPVYSVHRNPKIWENPLLFNPDRFLPQYEKERHRYSFLPFGGGNRVCMGQKYALTSMKAMISSVVRKYKIVTDYKMEDIKLSKSVTLNTSGLTISLEERNP